MNAQKEDLLAAYLQFAREGDANATNVNAQFWVGSLTQGGHTTSLYGKSKQEVEDRAREILASRGVEV